ncbi:glycosyl hydrolase family 8 [Levilactobacillus angrenensis]|uniref:Glycosyl hydrolase family 8 n=1 Tax=Levilactobacillus angrenensis TaxID=2486020 RepID=A0ABW1U801_9LACO|nr:glycosyl hydrolase family 8 [Levilactobacillus angrenensis]
MKKRHWWVLVVGFVALLLSSCQAKPATMTPPTTSPTGFIQSPTLHTAADQRHQQRLAQFIKTKLQNKQGIYTNYVDTKTRQSGTATGHELLSESAGMWLQYLAQSHQDKEFRAFYRATIKTFGDHGQFSYRYDPRSHKRFAVNATLDDLRIIRALNLYDAQMHTKHYRQAAADHFAALKVGALKDGKLYDYYDPQSRRTAKTSSLAYFDFKTLRYYERETRAGRRAYNEQLKVVRGGYLGNVFPLYAASFNWGTLTYSPKNLNTSEALEVLLHLAEVGQLKATSRTWLAQQVKGKKLYNGYSTAGSVTNRGQSTANYALAAMIFAAAKDQANYRVAMRLVWAGQVTGQSPISGGIGDAKSHQSYSYSNLTALNAASD